MALTLARAETPALDASFERVRQTTEQLCEPLATEDFVVQSMPDVSPTKWHLAHVTWFFETFVLKPLGDHEPFDPAYEYLFNSYYNAVGEQFPRAQRGLITRPTVDEVFAYRRYVDDAILAGLAADRFDARAREIIELGVHHEQQHQELLLMDLKHVLSCNPLDPTYLARPMASDGPTEQRWVAVEGDRRSFGAAAHAFAFDNELPRHERDIPGFSIADRPVSNGEYLAFIEDGAYANPSLWLSDGWTEIRNHGWKAPLYWDFRDDHWTEFTLHGRCLLDLAAPVCHISYYEADAFATWAGCRLPSEFEWEAAANACKAGVGFQEDLRFHPRAPEPTQLLGEVWEWTCSSYHPYPGYRAAAGALGEYNGKFMINQMVLRGGACVTPRSHIRTSYRNFFYPHMRWQFGGLRLARDVQGTS